MLIFSPARRFTSFDVYLNGERIDTTFHQGETVEEQKRSLIDHDGYDSGIEVYGRADTVIPLTKTEMRTLLEDMDAKVYQDVVKWRWSDESGASPFTFDTEEAAMRDAIEALDLDTKGEEDTFRN